MPNERTDLLTELISIVRLAPIRFAAGTFLGLALSGLIIGKFVGSNSSEIVANIQIGQYSPKIGNIQPLEHPKRALETIKQTVLDSTESQSHIKSYSYTTSTDPYNLTIVVNSSNPGTTRLALDAAISKIVAKQNAGYDRLSGLFEKKLGSLDAEQKAINEAVRETVSQTTNVKGAALSSIIAKSIITNNELAQIETNLLLDPAHFLRSQYSLSEHPKTMGRLRIVMIIIVAVLLAGCCGLVAAGAGGRRKGKNRG